MSGLRIHRLRIAAAAVAVTALALALWPGRAGSGSLPQAFDLVVLAVALLSALSLTVAVRQRGQLARRASRLADYNAVLAHANQAIVGAESEAELLQAVCEAAVAHGGFGLAVVARPDAHGRFRAMAAAGATDYFEAVEIVDDPACARGRGPMAQTWREGRAHFNNTFAGDPLLQPWREEAARHGLVGVSATLPVRRMGKVWGVFALYRRDAEAFAPELRALLLELAQDMSGGLDRLEMRGAEAAERERRILQQDLLRSLLANIDLLISSVDAGRLLPDFCTRLLESGLLIAAWIGRPDEQRRMLPLAWGGQAEDVLLAQPPLRIDQVPALREAWDSARQACDADPDSPLLQGWSGYALPGQSQEAIVMPIRREGEPWALLVTIAQGVELDADLRAILVRVAELLGLALEDIELKESLRLRQREEAHRARHDPLTGLPNRLGLENHVAKAIARARRKGTRIAVGLIDLDDFKPVNDAWGHEAGDRVLVDLAGRWQGKLRESDTLGRIGGDEFVVVIEDIESGQTLAQLGAVLGRLHEAVEQPFDVGSGASASLGMTMGLALFPSDGEDSDLLLRHADAAMYQAKRRKLSRTQWWRLWGNVETVAADTETTIDAYGVEAAELLRDAQPLFGALADRFVAEFYAADGEHVQVEALLRTLPPARFEALKLAQARHLRFLAAPGSSHADVDAEGARIGVVHALCGVNGAMLSRARALYRTMLGEQLNVARLTPRQRYRLLYVAEARLLDDLQAQHQAAQEVEGEYMAVLAQSLPQPGSLWVDASREEIRALGALPGVRCAMLLRLNPEGAFDIEQAAGPAAIDITSGLLLGDARAVLDPLSPRGRAMAALAWRSLEIRHSPSFESDPGYAPWRVAMGGLGLRSTLAIPVFGRDGRVVAVLSLVGGFHHQFESNWMQQWAAALQRRWEGVWAASGGLRAASVIPLEQARRQRDQLFGDGLTMLVQPVVDLRGGKRCHVEVLARLRMEDGHLLAPASFLPLLGNAELEHVFHGMLEQTLRQLQRWDLQGIEIDASINLPPSSLLDPACASRVGDALRRHGIAPDRIALELLETESIEPEEQQRAAAALLGIGVRLVMDDLGAGHSSILRLSNMPFDTVKIDKSLWQQLDVNPLQTVTLLGTLVTMCADLGRDVVIEGLERPTMIEVATMLGATHGQGYAFARPMPPDELPAWLRAREMRGASPTIASYAGALAYHWRRQHPSAVAAQPANEACPLSGFLERQGLRGSSAWEWHAGATRGDLDAARRLGDWLADQARAA